MGFLISFFRNHVKEQDPGMAAGEPERSSDLVRQFPQLLPGGDVNVARDDKTVASEIQTLETCGYNMSGPLRVGRHTRNQRAGKA